LALLFVADFRKSVGAALAATFGGLRKVFFDAPAAFLRLRAVRTVMDSPPVAVFQRYLFTPLLFTALALLTFSLLEVEPGHALTAGGAVFLATFLVFNSRLGRAIEENFADWLIRNWAYLRTGLLPGLFAAVMDFFRMLVEFVE